VLSWPLLVAKPLSKVPQGWLADANSVGRRCRYGRRPVAIDAALQGQPGIALGDAVGSNLVNIGLILGLTLLISGAITPRAMADTEQCEQHLGIRKKLKCSWEGFRNNVCLHR
jgi:hypothetical protein